MKGGRTTTMVISISVIALLIGSCTHLGDANSTISLKDAVDNTDLDFTTGGNANWFGQGHYSHFGGDAAKSGNISSNEETWLQTSVTGPGKMTFYWSVSSESGYDKLKLYINGVKMTDIDGSVDWQLIYFYVENVTVNIRWSYEKDGSIDSGEDCGWVDKVRWEPGEVWTVKNNNTGKHYVSIQRAIDNANYGNTIYVKSSNYYEHITVDKPIALVGENKHTTVINGSQSGTVMEIIADGVTINGFTFTNSGNDYGDAGIEINSNGNNISNNIISYNFNYGIYGSEISTNSISNNILEYNDDNAIYLSSSDNNFLVNNSINNNWDYGIYLYSSNNNRIIKNCISGNWGTGIYLNSCLQNNVSSNGIRGGESTGIDLSSSQYNNLTKNKIENNIGNGIELDESKANYIQNNNISKNDEDGIELWDSSHQNIICNNRVTDNEGRGIDIDSNANVVSKNAVSLNDGTGISVGEENNGIFENTITNNWGSGLSLSGRGHTIQNNSISNNEYSGVYVSSSAVSNQILDNIIRENSQGIDLSSSSSNTVKGNSIGYNSDCGIEILSSAHDNIIYQNNLYKNEQNARDGTTPESNQWDDGEKGNYWDDYQGNDTDHNGIGDTPYPVPPRYWWEDVSNYDNYPLMEPYGVLITPPTAPRNLKGIPGDRTTNLSWRDPFYNGGREITNYKIYRGNSSSQLYLISTIGNLSSYVDTGLTNGNTYYYRVSAVNEIGEGALSNQIAAKPVLPPNNPPNTPSKPSGQSSGNTGTSYSYATSATDSDGDQIKYYFDWDDGTGTWTSLQDSGQTASKSHTWSSPGTYNIRVKAQDEHGAESDWSTIKSVTITTYTPPPPNESPTCSISANPTSGYGPLDVTFSLSASDTDGSIDSWELDIDNDGSADYSGSGNPPATKSHTYQNVGEYTAQLTVTDDDGATESDTTTITVNETPNQAPTASFDYSPTNPTANTTITFTDTSTDTDGTIENCTWNFGDGTTGYGQTTNHTYTVPGTYNVTLTVTDDDGDTDSYIKSVEIKAPSKDKGGTPGFGLALFAMAIAVILLIEHKRNKR